MRACIIVAVAAGLCGCASAGTAPPRVTPDQLSALEARARRDTTDVDAQLRLAVAYRSQGRAQDALPVAQRALALRPGNARAALLVGLTQEDLGNLAQARDIYQGLSRTGPADLRSQLQARLVLLQRRETQVYVRSALAREAELARTPPRPHTVAVFPFRAPSDSVLSPLGRALSAMLITDLAQTDRLTVLDRTMVQVLLDEIRLGESGYVDEATAARGGRILGAERLVQGSLASAEERLQLDLAVLSLARPQPAAAPRVDTARKAPARPDRAAPRRPTPRRPETPAPKPAAPPEEQKAAPLTATRTTSMSEADQLDRLFEMEKRLALRLYAALGVELSPAERAAVTKRRTENLQALLAYGRGLQATDAGDYAAALRFFSESARLDPGVAPARQEVVASRALVTATRTTTDALAATATSVGMAAGTAALAAQEALTTLLRDPIAEILGNEGEMGKSTIELIIRRPGGAQ